MIRVRYVSCMWDRVILAVSCGSFAALLIMLGSMIMLGDPLPLR
jgi:hypothetical protein